MQKSLLSFLGALQTFYGAGINVEGAAYLVTELMEQGSLKAMLRNVDRNLGWPLRLRFSTDIAAGMRYLHSVGAVHRGEFAEKFLMGQWRF